jgi:hypothetical protein
MSPSLFELLLEPPLELPHHLVDQLEGPEPPPPPRRPPLVSHVPFAVRMSPNGKNISDRCGIMFE